MGVDVSEERANAAEICYVKELNEYELTIDSQNKVKEAIWRHNLPEKPIKCYIVKYLH